MQNADGTEGLEAVIPIANLASSDRTQDPETDPTTHNTAVVAAGRAQNQNRQTDNTNWNGPGLSNRNDSATVATPQDDSVRANNYNAQEVKASLKKLPEPKPAVYKPAEKTPTTTRSGNPWASKRSFHPPSQRISHYTDKSTATTMANGKDFFLELRRQVSAAQQGGGTTLGG